jgi:hypothetical protein
LARANLSRDDVAAVRDAFGLAIAHHEAENNMAEPGSDTDNETGARLRRAVILYRAADLAWAQASVLVERAS